MTWAKAARSVLDADGTLMMIELDNDEIEKIINCIQHVAKDLSDGDPWPEHQMIIDSLEMQRAKYLGGGTTTEAMFLAVPQARKVDH